MTKIGFIDTTRMRNDEYFQFHTEFRKIIAENGAEALKIETLCGEYDAHYRKTDDALKKILKSALTKKIRDAHKARNETWRAIVLANSAALKHHDPKVARAAQKVKIVTDTYGNIAKKPMDEATSAYYNVLQELQGKFAPDVETTGAKTWVAQLQARNIEAGKLIKERHEESAAQTDTVLRQARAELDKTYRQIIQVINALAILEGAPQYEKAAKAINTVIGKYAAGIAVRKGKSAAKRNKQAGENEAAEEQKT